jgi:hypothetical protein
LKRYARFLSKIPQVKTLLPILFILPLAMRDCGACYGAPITVALDFDGNPATIWDSRAIPATPAFTGDAAAVTALVAHNFAPFNVVVTQGSAPGVQGQSVRVVVGGPGDWFNGATGVTNLYAIYDPEPTAFVFSDDLLNRTDLVAAVITHELGHVGGCEHQSTWINGVKTAEYAPGYFMGDTSTSPLVWGVGRASSGVIQDDVAILDTTYGAAVPETVWGTVGMFIAYLLARRGDRKSRFQPRSRAGQGQPVFPRPLRAPKTHALPAEKVGREVPQAEYRPCATLKFVTEDLGASRSSRTPTPTLTIRGCRTVRRWGYRIARILAGFGRTCTTRGSFASKQCTTGTVWVLGRRTGRPLKQKRPFRDCNSPIGNDGRLLAGTLAKENAIPGQRKPKAILGDLMRSGSVEINHHIPPRKIVGDGISHVDDVGVNVFRHRIGEVAPPAVVQSQRSGNNRICDRTKGAGRNSCCHRQHEFSSREHALNHTTQLAGGN